LLLTVYDFIFVQFVVGPCFVVAWRGTWENADILFDEIIFKGNLKVSAGIALFGGTLVSAVVIFLQHELRAFANNGSK
jgi:hypothetical protein